MYYRLKEPWAFRGWKKTPYAIQAMYGKDKHEKPHFFEKEPFLELLNCNGQEEVNLEDFSSKTRQIVKEFLAHDVMEQSEQPMPSMQSWQRYLVYAGRYLETVHWSITGKCNFRCRHCLVSAPNAHHPQLPLEDCKHIIREIASCGITRVDITGGEPLVRTDFEEIVRELSNYGIDIGTLFTNASLLTEDTLKMMIKYHQRPTVQISFDGLGHHDWLRGIEGAEAQADTALRLLQKYEFPTVAAMCIHKGNKDSIRATANYLAKLDVLALRLNAPQELGLWKQYAEQYALTEDEVWDSDELKQKLEAALKRLAEEDRAQSDGELMVIAARELGYDISIAALEKAEAEAQELDLNELEKAAGGVQEWCLGNYACIDLYNSPESDEYDHNGMCITVWHCLTAFLHTDHGDSNNVLCWSNYQCVKWNN